MLDKILTFFKSKFEQAGGVPSVHIIQELSKCLDDYGELVMKIQYSNTTYVSGPPLGLISSGPFGPPPFGPVPFGPIPVVKPFMFGGNESYTSMNPHIGCRTIKRETLRNICDFLCNTNTYDAITDAKLIIDSKDVFYNGSVPLIRTYLQRAIDLEKSQNSGQSSWRLPLASSITSPPFLPSSSITVTPQQKQNMINEIDVLLTKINVIDNSTTTESTVDNIIKKYENLKDQLQHLPSYDIIYNNVWLVYRSLISVKLLVKNNATPNKQTEINNEKKYLLEQLNEIKKHID